MIGNLTALGNITFGPPDLPPHFQWWNYLLLFIGGITYTAIVGVILADILRKAIARIGRGKHG